MRSWLTALALLLWLPWAGAAIDAFPFDDPAKEDRYRQLSEELRCMVCQNQSLADSNAGLAIDLRRQLYEMVRDGHSNQEIVDYMVARYGDYVLYRPPMQPATYLLWFGPAILLLFGSVTLFLFVRRRIGANTGENDDLSDYEKQRLQRLLGEDGEERGQR